VDGQRLGRIAIVGDAWYCALAALSILLFAGPLAAALGVPTIVIVLAAVATAGWSVALRLVARQGGLRPWLARILVANVLAAGLIAALAVNRSPDAFSLLLLAVAAEVGAFAAVQAVALRRPF
jgi:hypothetical protein